MIRKTDGKIKIDERDRGGKLFNFRPVTFCALFLALGVSLGVFVVAQGGAVWWIVAVLPLAFLTVFFSLPTSRWAKWCGILCAISAIGFLSFFGAATVFRSHTVYEGECVVTGVVEEKEKNLYGYSVLLDDISIDGNRESGKVISSSGTRVTSSYTISIIGCCLMVSVICAENFSRSTARAPPAGT